LSRSRCRVYSGYGFADADFSKAAARRRANIAARA
jgi:hypothetical protein